MQETELRSDACGVTRVRVLGIEIDPLTIPELNERIGRIIDQGQKGLVLNVNANAMNIACEEPWFHAFLRQAHLMYCDGAGVQLAARLLGGHIPQRICLTDWQWSLVEYCSQRGYTLYLLGSVPGVARAAAQRFHERFPTTQILGTRDGYFHQSGPENEAVIGDINRLRPNILIVGMGMPLQEQWLEQNWKKLDVNILISGGACLDYASGRVRRCPTWMRENGLEWLFRLALEPRRMFRRYVIGNPLFLLRALKYGRSYNFPAWAKHE